MVSETMRWTLWALHIPESRFVEACPARWKQKQHRYMSIVLNQHIDSYVIAAFFFRAPSTIASQKMKDWRCLMHSLCLSHTHKHTDTLTPTKCGKETECISAVNVTGIHWLLVKTIILWNVFASISSSLQLSEGTIWIMQIVPSDKRDVLFKYLWY